MIDLKKLARAGSYRIAHDESASIPGQAASDRAWLVQIPGRAGHVFVQSRATLGAFIRARRNVGPPLARLLAIPGARLLARGDTEASVEFGPEHLAAVAAVLGLRRRRQVTEEQRAELAERLRAVRPPGWRARRGPISDGRASDG